MTMLTLTGDPVGDGGSSVADKRTNNHPPLGQTYADIALRELLPCWWRLVYPPGRAGPMGNTFMRCARQDADALTFYCLHCGQPRHQRCRHEIRLISRRIAEAEPIAYQTHIWDVPARFDFHGEEWDELSVTPRLERIACQWGARIERGMVVSLDRIR
jgi:hypothetical protein